MKTLFLNTSSLNAKLFILAVISIVSMTIDHRKSHLETVRSILSTMVYPLQYTVNLPFQAGHWVSESLASHKVLLEENRRLREERQMLNSRLQRFSILEEENNRLRALLGASTRLDERVLVAELIAVEQETFRQQIVINRGQREGVYDGQPVVDAGGVMGQVIHVGPFSSTVLLITDPGHSLPVQVNRNGLRAVATGSGRTDVLSLEHLPVNADIRTGDLIVTSGLGHRFPRGYPVGSIQEIDMDPGEPFARITVVPSASLASSREVLLLWPYEEESGSLGLLGQPSGVNR